MTHTGAVFVMPRRSTEWADAPVLWVTAAGWAAATAQRFGTAWVVTRDVIASPSETLDFTRPRPVHRRPTQRVPAPLVVRTAVKDAVRTIAALRDSDPGEPPQWRNAELLFVWQHHDPFNRAGERLARRRGVPIVTYVHAPQVWEASRWGVRRPGWDRLLEQYGDRPPLLHSDVVACVSDEVADEVVRLGVDPERVLVSPMAVDAERFSPAVSGAAVRERFDLGDAFVVGWTGSFRTFHALDRALDVFAELLRKAPEAKLFLVGDGPERESIRELAAGRGLGRAVVFPGAQANEDLPGFIAAMDVAIVTARSSEDFHYSPEKLREFLSMGRAVVAPRVGDVGRTVTHGVDGLLYDVGDDRAFVEHLVELRDDPALRASLGRAGRHLAERTCTWSVRVDELMEFDGFRRAARW